MILNIILTMILPMLVACSSPSDSASSCVHDSGGGHPTWSNFGEAFFLTYCDACHAADSPNRFDAPVDVTFDTEAEVQRQIDAIWDSVVVRQSMPRGGGLPTEDLEALQNYIGCIQDAE